MEEKVADPKRTAYFRLRSKDPDNLCRCRQDAVLVDCLSDKLTDQLALLGFVGSRPVGCRGCCNEHSSTLLLLGYLRSPQAVTSFYGDPDGLLGAPGESLSDPVSSSGAQRSLQWHLGLERGPRSL